ncbi:unnamed protein product [Paramecium sonneborni]|uniref:C2 NT-type domain-containing protein n=1 Tax=Paramecium sonneborni TaxID=65129 RepID=A0A8S1PIJ4_9CILI|nr:unnamed protein product [Paramecium sonneborni]
MNNTRVFKFCLKAFIERVVIAINFPCKLQVAWKRGNQKLETKQSDLNVNVANFNEELEMNSNLYFEDNRFKEKKCAFTVTLLSQKGNKVAGQISLDISTYLNRKVENIREELKLDKCPDKHAKIHVRFQFICIEELDIDQLSRISYASNVDQEDQQNTIQNSTSQQIEVQQGNNNNQQVAQQNYYQQQAIYTEQDLDEIRTLLSQEMKKVQQKDNQISQLEQSLETKQEQLTDTKQQLEATKQKLYETLDKLQNFEESVLNQDEQRKNSENKIKYLELQNKSLQQKIIELTEQLKLNQQLVVQSDQKLSNALGQMQVMKQRINQYEELELQEQNRKSTGNSKDMELMQKKINDLEKQIQREQKKQEQDYALYQIQLKNVQAQLSDKTELINKLQQEKDFDNKDASQIQQFKKQIQQYQQNEEQFNKVLNQYKDQIQKANQNEKKLKQQQKEELDNFSDQIIKLKCQLGDLFNTAYDIGGNKLVDRLQQAVGLS